MISRSSRIVGWLFSSPRVFKARIDNDELIHLPLNWGRFRGKEVISNFSKPIHHPPKTLTSLSFFLERSSILSSFLFIRWRRERERGQDRNGKQTLVFWVSSRCVTLVAMKNMFRRIRSRDMMPPPKGMHKMDERAFSSPNLRDDGFPPSGLEFCNVPPWRIRRRYYNVYMQDRNILTYIC